MRNSLLLLVIIASVFASSCKHYCHNNPYPMLKFVNFDSSDLNTVVVTERRTDMGCPTCLPLEHTTVYTTRQTFAQDTMNFGTRYAGTPPEYLISLNFNADATIYILATGKTYQMRGYTFHRDSWESVNCTNSMSYYLNDVQYSQPMQPGGTAQGLILINK